MPRELKQKELKAKATLPKASRSLPNPSKLKSSRLRSDSNTGVLTTTLEEDLKSVAKSAETIRGFKTSADKRTRIDILLFFSFDLVGSTELKKTAFENRTWIDVIRRFYGICKDLIKDQGINEAHVWKLIGDEVVFFKKIKSPDDVEKTVIAIYKSLLMINGTLSTSLVGDEAENFVSVKAVAWIAPIKSEVNASTLSDEHNNQFQELFASYIDDDVQIKTDEKDENSSIDFLGPNIDAGFRISKFARKLQLVLSPGLAKYLLDKKQNDERMKIVGFESLKGVAKGNLFPGIWYHEHWSEIKNDFDYRERHGDDNIIKSVCKSSFLPIKDLTEVSKIISPLGYFFDDKLIDNIISLSSKADSAVSD